MKTDLKKPCNECPFRRRSLPGWLGPWEPRELLLSISMSAIPFTCHQTIPEDPEADIDEMQMCAGAAIFLTNKLEVYRGADGARYQEEMKSVPDEVKRSVFDSSAEFVDHHTSLGKLMEDEHGIDD